MAFSPARNDASPVKMRIPNHFTADIIALRSRKTSCSRYSEYTNTVCRSVVSHRTLTSSFFVNSPRSQGSSQHSPVRAVRFCRALGWELPQLADFHGIFLGHALIRKQVHIHLKTNQNIKFHTPTRVQHGSTLHVYTPRHYR